MPKIRTKKNNPSYSRVFNTLAAKSGTCTSSIGSILDHDQLSFSYFNHEIIHSTLGFETKTESFNDNFTNIFIEQDIIPTLGIPRKSFDLYENNILHTPNEFSYATTNTDLITAIPNKNSFNNILSENYIKTELTSYKEDLNKNNDVKRNSINISFNKATLDIKLSFSLNSNTSSLRTITDSDGNEIVSFPEFNGNTVILENGLKTDYNYSYIGNIKENYFLNILSFLNAPICFNGLTTFSSSADKRYESNYLTLPIQDFGFPYSEKFKGQDRHLIRMGQYITKPFVIEKIRLRANISNYSVMQSSKPCINFINFYIINQKGKLNPENVSEDYEVTDYVEGTTLSSNFSNLPTRFTSIIPKYSQNIEPFDTSTVNSGSYVTEESQPLFGYETIPLQQRDLISTITIANYSQPASNNTFYDREKISNNVDLFIDNTDLPKLNSSHNVECIYENKNIEIISDVKNFYSNKNLNRFSSFNVYPRKEYSNRTNTFIRSGRSVSNEGLNNTSQTVYNDTDLFDKNIIHREVNSTNDGYILKPEDTIYIGISLSTQFDIQESNLSGRDYVTIGMSDNKPLLIDLIGYYLEEGKEKRINSKEVKQYKSVKKIGYGLREVVDQIGSNYACLDQNFYDYWFKDAESKVALGETEKDFALSAYYRQGEFTYSNFNKTRLGNFAEIPNLSVGIYNFNAGVTFTFPDSITPTIMHDTLVMNKDLFNSEVYKEEEASNFKLYKHYYNKYRFGMFSDKLNHNKIYQFADAKYQNINKKFKKGFYIEKVAGTIKGKINFDFTGIHEYTGRNFLTEKIFDSSEIHTWTPPSPPGADPIALELATLEAKFTDENDKKIKFIFQIPIFNGTTGEKTIYAQDELGLPSEEYIDGVFVYTTTLPVDVAENFININFGTNTPVAEYTQGGRILTLVNETLFAIMINKFTLGFAAAGINITPSISQNSQKEFLAIDFEINNKGKFNNASLQAGRGGSNISYENFVIEEGDIINSYNTDKHAYYSNSDVIFKDNY